MTRARANPLYKRASLPARAVEVASAGTGDGGWESAYQATLNHCLGGGAVLLCGERWTGKTVMATKVALHYLAMNKGAVYTRGIGLLKDLRLDFNSNDVASRELVRPYQKWHLLIIDEVGIRVRGENGYSESDAALISDLVDQRYSDRLSTIFISNESEKNSLEVLGPSIARRIMETGIVIPANWKPFSE